MASVFVAVKDAVVRDAEQGFVSLRAGVTRVLEGHPMLEQNPELFKPADEDAHFQVRTAKAEPKAAPATADPKAPADAEPKDQEPSK